MAFSVNAGSLDHSGRTVSGYEVFFHRALPIAKSIRWAHRLLRCTFGSHAGRWVACQTMWSTVELGLQTVLDPLASDLTPCRRPSIRYQTPLIRMPALQPLHRHDGEL